MDWPVVAVSGTGLAMSQDMLAAGVDQRAHEELALAALANITWSNCVQHS